MPRASCPTLELNEFRCYEVKIEESEKKVCWNAGALFFSNLTHDIIEDGIPDCVPRIE